ncbi:uncharacterized protein LOC135692921 [Rhopilema esculentum]|uniref:uncharacterized protein LOC135692921 n=1 Tax=Rhopilema esculentum TaxID=499914 RepID=UPI0031E0650A
MSVQEIVLKIIFLTVVINGQQLSFKNCVAYNAINESNYSRDPTSSNPLGYFSGVLPYTDGQTQKVTPCVEVKGIPSTAYVEIKCETNTGGAKICVGDENTLRECGQGRLRSCYSAPSSNLKFAFYCDTACEQVDVSFWYRFVPSEANPSDQWCENRPSDDYPSSLITAPTNLPTASTKSNVNGGSLESQPALEMMYLTCVAAVLLLFSFWT